MVLSAFQQAGAHQQFQQFHTGIIQNSMAAAAMGPSGAQNLAGGLMSQGAAMGGPGLMGAAGMLGLDPMSLGLRAGMGAWSSGAGVLGAGMAGMGAMAGAGLVIGAGALVGGQMLSGAQQQLSLNRGLAQNFNFMNNQGGMGFTGNQGFQIGAGLREMAGQFGPGGEVTSFGELSRLAQNMGRMGMAQNVRSVKEFKEKFTQMLTTLKTVATELGTSLEEAQKTVASMRQVGVFKPGAQMAMAHQMRVGATAGGLAMSEVSGMAQIGSQIARSVGGLGRAGAFGGARTIGQVGAALQTGALSEEDIYNATGLTGAEGRQAFATNMMQRSAQFLKSGRGRRFLASVAGSNGELDNMDVMEWMTGEVGTGRTMQMAYKNLAGVGRANFIRNEGRLRGAALERFGGFIQPMVYKQWLSQLGWDPNNMDDRAMLAFQRFSGLGRDEAESALKVVNRLPELLRHQQRTEGLMERSDELVRARRTTGIEGVKRKLEMAREHIQGALQQKGADFLQSGTDMIESWVGKITGIYVQEYTKRVDEAFAASLRGDKVGQEQFNRVFGGAFRGGGGGAGITGMRRPTAAQFYGGGGGLLGGAFKSEAERFGEAGYTFKEGMSMEGIQNRMKEIERTSSALRNESSAASVELGRKNSQLLRSAIASGKITGRGEARLESYRQFLRAKADSGDRGALEMLNTIESTWGKDGSTASGERMNAIAGMLEGAEVTGEREMFAPPSQQFDFGAYMTGTEAERAQLLGDAALGKWTEAEGQKRSGWAKAGAITAAVLGGSLLLPVAFGAGVAEGAGRLLFGKSLFGGIYEAMESKLDDWVGEGPNAAARKAMGLKMMSDEGRDLISKVQSADTRSEALKKSTNRIVELRRDIDKGKELTADEQGELEFHKSVWAAGKMSELKEKYKDKDIPESEMKAAAEELGMTVGDFAARAETTAQFDQAAAAQDYLKASKQYGKQARTRIEGLVKGGKAEYVAGELQLKALTLSYDEKGRMVDAAGKPVDAQYEKLMKGGMKDYAHEFLEAQRQLGGMEGTNAEADKARHKKSIESAGKMRDILKGKTVEEMRAMAAWMEEQGLTEGEGGAQDIMYKAGLQSRIEKGVKGGKKGMGRAMASMFGLQMDRKTAEDLFGKGGDVAAQRIAAAQGIDLSTAEGRAYMAQLKEVTGGMAGGTKEGIAKAREAMAGLMDSPALKEAQKKKEEQDPSVSRLEKIASSTKTIADNTEKLIGAVKSVETAVGKKNTEEEH